MSKYTFSPEARGRGGGGVSKCKNDKILKKRL
jgi:hypothetical protein